MKKKVLTFLLLISIGMSTTFALLDTDGDGVYDDKDLCPRVYARSKTGCPTLSESKSIDFKNPCYRKITTGIIVRIQPICDTKTSICPSISSVAGMQICDPIFPLIMQDGKPFVRGGIYIVGFYR